MIPEGVHAPEQVVEAESHPRQWNVVAQVRGPHPAELGPGEPPIVRVLEEIRNIVPAYKLVLQRRQERVCRRSEEHTSELQSRLHLVCRLLLEKKKTKKHY